MSQLNRLTDRKVKSELKPGKYRDGGCLVLLVKVSGTKSFAFTSEIKLANGKKKYVSYGLGGYPTVSLAQARLKAAELRLRIQDPVFRAQLEQGLSVRNILEKEARIEAARMIDAIPTFGEFSKRWMDENLEHRIKNIKTRKQWYSTMETYAVLTFSPKGTRL